MTRAQRFEPYAWSVLRIVAGGMFLCHGLQKILGLFTERSGPAAGSQLWIGGIIELVGGTLIALGLFARPAALIASGTMAVAYFQFHWKLAGGEHVLPIVNGGELAVLYCFVFLAIALRGPGPIALGRKRG